MRLMKVWVHCGHERGPTLYEWKLEIGDRGPVEKVPLPVILSAREGSAVRKRLKKRTLRFAQNDIHSAHESFSTAPQAPILVRCPRSPREFTVNISECLLPDGVL